MIIVSNKNTSNYLFFPQNLYTENTDIYRMTLTDRGTNVEYSFEDLEDYHLIQYDYYTFLLKFNNLPQGEYEYKIFDSNDELVGSGIIRLKELIDDTIYYDKNNEYVIYG